MHSLHNNANQILDVQPRDKNALRNDSTPYWMTKQNNIATAGEEHGTVSLMFSNYCTSLEQSACSRYQEKCRKCGFDPYALNTLI